MAITEIHAIKTTPHLALHYIIQDKVQIIKSENEINKDVPHETWVDNETGNMFVRYFTRISYKDCSPLNPFKAFDERRKQYQNERNAKRNKDGKEPLMYHLTQSFDGFEVDYNTANEIGRKLADRLFEKFVVVIATHGNTDNIHNHFDISAWDSDGKKLNNSLSLVNLIRKESDKLCEEYGLSVLESTRTMKLVTYKDKEGNSRAYEPTDRKNELISKRRKGEITTDDVNSYRNSNAYNNKQIEKITNREEIKNDINNLLPSCRSYEELLLRLRELGYIIRAKKKNGEWLKHISFQAPTHEKATREDKLDDSGFYIRENLTRYIDELNLERNADNSKSIVEEQTDEIPNVPYFNNYEYGKTNIDDVNADYKTVVDSNGELKTVPRTEYEKKVVKDIKRSYKKLNSPLTNVMNRKEQQTQLRFTAEQRTELIERIQNSYKCLHYTEEHNIYSYQQILDLYKANKDRYDITIDKVAQIEKAILQLKEIQKLPDKLSEVLNRVEEKKNDIIYIMEDYQSDKKEINRLSSLLVKYKIDTPEKQKEFFEKIAEFESKQQVNRGYLAKAIYQMSELENCLLTYNRIDKEAGVDTRSIISEFANIREGISDNDFVNNNNVRENENGQQQIKETNNWEH